MKNILSWIGLLVAIYLIPQSTSCGQERFGGIEIGAKGIKVSVIEVKAEQVTVLNVDKNAVNVNLAKIKDQKFGELKIGDVGFVVNNLKKWMNKDLFVSDENIRVIASSGVPSFADDFDSLVAEIRSSCKLDLEKISASEEAALTNLALIPVDQRTRTMVVDIGSGNTKGGTFVNEAGAMDDFISMRVPFGTSSLARRVEEIIKTSGGDSSSLAQQIAQLEVGDRLAAQFQSHPAMKDRETILLAGGSVWAMTTMMKPGEALNSFPKLTAQDISNYQKWLKESLPGYPKPDFSSVQDPNARKAAEADYNRIVGGSRSAIFSPKELFAGATVMEQVARTLEFKNKNVMFDRKAKTAWITAKITPEAYRDQLPDALGRDFPGSNPQSD